MTTDVDEAIDAAAEASRAREARRRVIEKIAELILAEADAVEEARREDFSERLLTASRGPREEADPEVLRRFVEAPLFRWLAGGYIAGDAREHPLPRVVEVLRDLAPGAFGGARHGAGKRL